MTILAGLLVWIFLSLPFGIFVGKVLRSCGQFDDLYCAQSADPQSREVADV